MFFVRSCLLFACVTFQSGLASAQDSAPPLPAQDLLAPYRDAAIDRWEPDIVKLEAKNQREKHPADSILFIGSSSIRRWKTIDYDVAPYHPIQRGYGGAKFSDLAVYAQRIIEPHSYRALVVFVANDISGSKNDHSVDEVAKLVQFVMQVSFAHQPEAPVVFIEITPTSSRFSAWARIRQLNARIRDIALATPHTYFIPTAQHFLHPDGTPRDDLFVDDKLHLNRSGYEIWGHLVRRRLNEVLRSEMNANLAQ